MLGKRFVSWSASYGTSPMSAKSNCRSGFSGSAAPAGWAVPSPITPTRPAQATHFNEATVAEKYRFITCDRLEFWARASRLVELKRAFMGSLDLQHGTRLRRWAGETPTLRIQLRAAPPFTGSEDLERLAQARRGLDEGVRRHRVELEHLEVARDDESGADFPGQRCGLGPIEIARHSTLRTVAIDRQQRHVDGPALQPFFHSFVAYRVAGVINRPRPGLDDIAQELVPAGLVSFERVMRGGHGVNPKVADLPVLSGIEADRQLGGTFQAVHDELAVGLRDDELHARIGAQQRHERLLVQMVRVVVAGRDDVHELHPFGCDDPSGHANVRSVGGGVL